MLDEAGSPPDPAHATSAAEYVAALARLRRWSGLTYRRLAAKAGGALPASTMAGVLGRATLPREDFVVAFVAACGLDEAEIDRWVRARRTLAAGATGPAGTTGAGEGSATTTHDSATTTQNSAAHDSAATTQDPATHDSAATTQDPATHGSATGAQESEPRAGTPAEAGPEPAARLAPETPRRHPVRPAVWRSALVVVVVVALVLMAGPALLNGAGDPLESHASASHTTSPGVLPDGWYLVRPAHVADRDLCVGEGLERSGRTDRPLAVQRSCAALTPDTYLKSLGAGVYELQWHHPVQGVGCLTVDQAHLGDEALVAPTDCTGAAHQRFLLAPAHAGRGHVLRPVHSGKCLGLLYGEADIHPGAELAQLTCSGKRDQIFRLDPTDRPDWLKQGQAPTSS
ncbi:XRE family transcriptional regulator [Nonomuraea indica]|uniref:XRE family transcriptional regulator n=1 Tax=Nonomuraea indica TaxID=1581193 RepID=UPI0011832A7D|nr:XRE family transcriptional regulator [Nonomuraea indica]